MIDKKNKVRTSITIDPDLLASVRKDAVHSVSAYIEDALKFYQASLLKNKPVDGPVISEAIGDGQ